MYWEKHTLPSHIISYSLRIYKAGIPLEIWRLTLLALTETFSHTYSYEYSPTYPATCQTSLQTLAPSKRFHQKWRCVDPWLRTLGSGEPLQPSPHLVCPRWSSEPFKWPLLSSAAEWAPAKVSLPSARQVPTHTVTAAAPLLLTSLSGLLQLFWCSPPQKTNNTHKKIPKKTYARDSFLSLNLSLLALGCPYEERSPPGSSPIAAVRVRTLQSDSLQPRDSKCIQLHRQYSVIKFPGEVSTESGSCVSPH